MLEEELRAGLEQTKRNLAEVPSGSDGGTYSDNRGSELGVPPEVADERHAFREREWKAARQRVIEEADDEAAIEIDVA